MSNIRILPFRSSDESRLAEHFQRHRAESGREGVHFMPFAPDDPDGPRGMTVEKAFLEVNQPGWQRWFCAHNGNTSQIVGHVDLKSDPLRAGLHRCELGIGIEADYRHQGIGHELMSTAIAFIRDCHTIEWIDLKVFSNNLAARSLYRQMGFIEVGTVTDRFRIDSQSIDDVIMTLHMPKKG